jgi:hypothetical protein
MPTQFGPGALAGAAEAGVGYAADPRSDTTIAPDAATRTTCGARPTVQRNIVALVVAWRPRVKSALRGLATVELPIGLTIRDVAVFVSKNGPFATLPSKPQIDKEGRHKTDANGKPAYAAVLEWLSRELSDRFSQVVVAAIRQLSPSALEEPLSTTERSASAPRPSRSPYARQRPAPAHDSNLRPLPDDPVDDLYMRGEQ